MKAARSLSALILALLVLVSSTSIMLGMHLCMGEVENIALFSKAEACEKEPPCHQHTKAPCCDDTTVIHEADDFKTSAENHFSGAPLPLIATQAWVVLSEFIPASPRSRSHHYNYDPPLRSFDLTVRHQVFLI